MTKILVIEDEGPIRDKIEMVLRLEGYDVMGAADGESGVAAAIAQSPDLIICDVLMPRMNGYSALSALRSDDRTAAIPVIFLTAAVSRQDMRKSMELGADDFIPKPYTVDELLTAVQTRLARQATIRRSGAITNAP
jgi:DNA-binding response OmpR family regulator